MIFYLFTLELFVPDFLGKGTNRIRGKGLVPRRASRSCYTSPHLNEPIKIAKAHQLKNASYIYQTYKDG
jgi:hypothetical protein